MSARREEILEAALDIADERGLAAVSMRAVADRVGVTPMALYPHVGGKAALLDGMVGQLLLRLAPEGAHEGGAEPFARLAELGRRMRGLVREHPWSATLFFSRPSITPDGVRSVDRMYVELLAAGVPAVHVPRVERLLSTFVIGYAASEAGGRFGSAELDPRERRGHLPEGDLPGHSAVSRSLAVAVDWDAEFEADLDDLRRLVLRLAGEDEG
jgi:AcrR family transcriptional regulator